MSLIIENLYIGNIRDATELRHFMKTIINVSHVPTPSADYHISLNDVPEQPLLPSLCHVADLIHKVKGNGPVLVHCQAGISRSVACVMGYLMLYENLRMNETLRLIKSKRPQAQPNQGFMRKLRFLDEDLYGSSEGAPHVLFWVLSSVLILLFWRKLFYGKQPFSYEK